MKKLSALEELDFVLNYLNKGNRLAFRTKTEYIVTEFENKGYTTNSQRVEAIINQLLNHGYIRYVESDINGTDLSGYEITFQGVYFLESDGGYYDEQNEKKKIEKEKTQLEKRMNDARLQYYQYRKEFLQFQKEYHQDKENQARVSNKLQSQMVLLTRWVAIGTLLAALYYLNELCRYYHWFSFCDCH